MGDLQMLNFDCEAELGKVLNLHSPTAAVRWGTLPAGRRPGRPHPLPAHLPPRLPLRLQVRLRDAAGGMRTDNCTINRPDFSCPVCVPSPPPPPPPPPPSTGVQGGARAVLRGDDAAAAEVLLLVRADRRLAQRHEVRGPLPLGRRRVAAASNGRGGAHGLTPLPTHPPSPFSPAPGAWLPPAAFELLTEKYAPPECGAEKAMDANKVRTRLGPGASSGRPTADHPHSSRSSSSLQVLALVARKFPAMCKAVRENACQGFCNDQCPAGSKKQVLASDAPRTQGASYIRKRCPAALIIPLLPSLLPR